MNPRDQEAYRPRFPEAAYDLSRLDYQRTRPVFESRGTAEAMRQVVTEATDTPERRAARREGERLLSEGVSASVACVAFLLLLAVTVTIWGVCYCLPTLLGRGAGR